MTCTTHHICDCLMKKMEKLEAVAEAARDLQDSAYYSGYYDLDKALEELDQP